MGEMIISIQVMHLMQTIYCSGYITVSDNWFLNQGTGKENGTAPSGASLNQAALMYGRYHTYTDASGRPFTLERDIGSNTLDEALLR